MFHPRVLAPQHNRGGKGAFVVNSAATWLAVQKRYGRCAGPDLKRAGQYLALGAKSRALLRGQMQATVEDVQAVAHCVLRHRIFTNFTAQAEGIETDQIIDHLLEKIPAESEKTEKAKAA